MMESSRGTERNTLEGWRLLFEGVIDVLNIFRLRREEKLRWTREHRARQHYTAKQTKTKTRSKAHQSPKLKRKDTRVNRSDENSMGSRASSVSGEQNIEDDDPRHMMTGAITRTADPHSYSESNTERKPSRSSLSGSYGSLSQSDTEPEEQGHRHSHCKRKHKHKQRHNSKGEPLIRGRHGWRTPPIGPPPTYKFHKNATLGYATHIKNCMEWGKKEHEHQQRKKERRQRGTLKERKIARIRRKEKENVRGKGIARVKSKEKDVERSKRESRENRRGSGRATYRGNKSKSDLYETHGQYQSRAHKSRDHKPRPHRSQSSHSSSSSSSSSISSISISNSTHPDAESPHTHSRTNTPSLHHDHEEEVPKHGAVSPRRTPHVHPHHPHRQHSHPDPDPDLNEISPTSTIRAAYQAHSRSHVHDLHNTNSHDDVISIDQHTKPRSMTSDSFVTDWWSSPPSPSPSLSSSSPHISPPLSLSPSLPSHLESSSRVDCGAASPTGGEGRVASSWTSRHGDSRSRRDGSLFDDDDDDDDDEDGVSVFGKLSAFAERGSGGGA